MLPPFTTPLASVTDPDAWRGGKHRAPTWRWRPGTFTVDTPSVHALVRAANLPRAELLHMGWTEELLSASAPEWLPLVDVEPLLGRMVADSRYDRGESGVFCAWFGDPSDHSRAGHDGRRVIEAWFRA